MQEMIHLLLSSNHKTNIFHFLVSPFTGNVAKGAMIMAVSILVVFFLIWMFGLSFFFLFSYPLVVQEDCHSDLTIEIQKISIKKKAIENTN